MKIKKIKILNFRLLKDFHLDLEKDLSLVIGKNNSGKTSLLAILEKFIGQRAHLSEFSCDDFNIDFQKKLKAIVEGEEVQADDFLGIQLKLFIEYEKADNLSNLSKVIMDLDPGNNTVVLCYEFKLRHDDVTAFTEDYKEFASKKTAKYQEIIDEANKTKPKGFEITVQEHQKKLRNIFNDFLKDALKRHFDLTIKTVLFDTATQEENDLEYVDLTNENIKFDKLINFRVIGARREVSNKDSNKALSLLSSKYYEKKEGLQEDSSAVDNFKETLSDTDDKLDVVYVGLFKGVIDKIATFGGVKPGDSLIKIISTLQHKDLLKGNTTVMYDHNEEHSLPEHYNGLGYMNLIGMIFEIEVLLTDFRKDDKENEEPADINLLFIEEPEAHTHPQMQYVFIKNIKGILSAASKGEGGLKNFNLQTIITTHSSHIAAESQFNDIKYFTQVAKNEVKAKNLKDLEKEYDKHGEKENFKFLKQYLTLNRAELFFADKAIFIEGDTERILLPAMMRKIDQENPANPLLLSQNISIVEVGAYSHIFEKFINFINVKSLIITDIDSAKLVKKTNKKGEEIMSAEGCEVTDSDASLTTNASLKFFFSQDSLGYYTALTFVDKTLSKSTKWSLDKDGNLGIVFQTNEQNSKTENYHARSFEDAFFHLNRQFVIDNKTGFKSLKNINHFDEAANSPYLLATECIDKKPSFAMEVLLNSKDDAAGKNFSNWDIPNYIKEGLLWLQTN